MKKILLAMLGCVAVSGAYAQSYDMYQSPDKSSEKLATIDDQNTDYSVIFTKGEWVELVNTSNGQVGWVYQPENNIKAKANSNAKPDAVSLMLQSIEEQHRIMQDNFNKSMDDLDMQMHDLQLHHNDDMKTSFKSISIQSDGKTATIVKKTDDGNGNVETVEKEVPASDLSSVSI